MIMMLAQEELVSHSCDVITNDDVPCFRLDELFIESGHGTGLFQVVSEQLFKVFHRTVAILGDCRVIVNMGEEKALEFCIVCGRVRTEASKPFRSISDVLRG